MSDERQQVSARSLDRFRADESERLEITPEMIEAGFEAALENYPFWDEGLNEDVLRKALGEIYHAMRIAAKAGEKIAS